MYCAQDASATRRSRWQPASRCRCAGERAHRTRQPSSAWSWRAQGSPSQRSVWGWLGNAGNVLFDWVQAAIADSSTDHRAAGSAQLPPRTSRSTQGPATAVASRGSPPGPGSRPVALAPSTVPSRSASPYAGPCGPTIRFRASSADRRAVARSVAYCQRLTASSIAPRRASSTPGSAAAIDSGGPAVPGGCRVDPQPTATKAASARAASAITRRAGWGCQVIWDTRSPDHHGGFPRAADVTETAPVRTEWAPVVRAPRRSGPRSCSDLPDRGWKFGLEGAGERPEGLRERAVPRCLRGLLGDDRAQDDDTRVIDRHQAGTLPRGCPRHRRKAPRGSERTRRVSPRCRPASCPVPCGRR